MNNYDTSLPFRWIFNSVLAWIAKLVAVYFLISLIALFFTPTSVIKKVTLPLFIFALINSVIKVSVSNALIFLSPRAVRGITRIRGGVKLFMTRYRESGRKRVSQDVPRDRSILEAYSGRRRSDVKSTTYTIRARQRPPRGVVHFRDVVISESARKSTATLTRVSIMAARH